MSMDLHEREQEIGARRQAAAGQVEELRQRVANLGQEHQDHLVAGRFDDADVVRAELAEVQPQLAMAESDVRALDAAQRTVSTQRQRAEHEAQLAEAVEQEDAARAEVARLVDEVVRPALETLRTGLVDGQRAEAACNLAARRATDLRVALGQEQRTKYGAPASYAVARLVEETPALLTLINTGGL